MDSTDVISTTGDFAGDHEKAHNSHPMCALKEQEDAQQRLSASQSGRESNLQPDLAAWECKGK